METRSETPRETWLKPIVALLGEGDFGEAYALAAYFPNTRNRQLVQLAALLGENKVTEASDLLGGLSRSWIRMMIKEPQEMSESVTQILVAEFATILSQVDLNLLETAYKAIENRYFQLADFCIQFQLLTHPETSLSVIGEGLRKTEFVQDINLDVKGEPTIKVPPDKVAGGKAYSNRIYPIRGGINKCGEFIRPPCSNQSKPRRPPNSLTIERHTRIEFPSECVLEQKVDLKIQLTQEIPEFTRVLEKILLTVGLNTKQVKLNVKVTAPAFAIRPYQQQLTVPVKGDSNEVIFTLVPLERGEQVIEIEFFRGATRVGYVIVQTNVTFYWYREKSPKVLSMEDPIDGLKNLESMTVNPDKHTLNVTWIDRESKLLYTIFPANRLGEWKKTIPNIQQQIEEEDHAN
jgi:hypothetical protein